MAGGLLARSGADAALARVWLDQSERSTSEPRTRAKTATKGWIETKSGPTEVVLYRLTEEGLNAKKLPHPNPRAKATVLEGEMTNFSRDTKARD
jgi:hypothetical protein